MEKALGDLHKEKEAEKEEKRRYLEERVPPLDLEGLDQGTNISRTTNSVKLMQYCSLL